MKLIHDNEMLDSFLSFIAANANDFTNINPYYMHLLYRGKDNTATKNHTTLLDRMFGTTAQVGKELRKLDILTEQGFYAGFEEGMCAYFSVNARCMHDATIKLSFDLVRALGDNVKLNLYSSVENVIQSAKTLGKYLVLDYDDVEETIPEIQDWLTGINVRGFGIRTKSGYHICVDTTKMSEICPKQLAILINDADQKGKNLLSPMPGTMQRGFPVTYFLFQEEVANVN
jgi:hypothetical protein